MVIDGALAWTRRRYVLSDTAVSAALLTSDLVVAPWLTGDPGPSAAEATLIALSLAALPLRSRMPVQALVLTTAGTTAVLALRGLETFGALAPLFALYSVAVRTNRRSTLLAWAATAGVLMLASALTLPSNRFAEEALPVLPWTAAAAAVGDGLRNRRALMAALEERAIRAERSREEEALRRVMQERVRIARELHDVVAHHIAVVNVQAGVAGHLLLSQPSSAAEALSHVRKAASAVLDELGEVLSVLREPGESTEGSAPSPGLSRLDALVSSFAAAGLVVDWSLHGRPRPLPPMVDLVAYRVLEEGLTNALKHGTGRAHLSVDYATDRLRLRVVNEIPAPAAAGTRHGVPAGAGKLIGRGHGLLGMRERAAAVGGTVSAEPGQGDVFCVHAELPLRSAP